MLEYSKLQVGCLFVIFYIAVAYIRGQGKFWKRRGPNIYEALLSVGLVGVCLDGITAYTVNHLEEVNPVLNDILHMLFLLSLDCFIFLLFIYMLILTEGIPKQRSRRMLVYTPFILNVILVVVNMPTLEYCQGELTNYSM